MLRWRRRWLLRRARPAIWIGVSTASLLIIVSTYYDNDGPSDFGLLILNLVLLLITAATLQLTIPESARLWIDNQVELGIDDLIFYIVGDNAQGQPRDYLLQLHVAVANVGGRKAILSYVELTAFLGAKGEILNIGIGRVKATQYTTTNRWIDTHAVLVGQQNGLENVRIRDEQDGPYPLAPDDVINLRIRSRGVVDWSDHWDLNALTDLASTLTTPIVKARLTATFRRSDELVTKSFDVPLKVIQQQMYLNALLHQTKNLTVRPAISHQPFVDLD